jgi:glycosyltransferase involved in cell wall biosynthesis
MKRPLVALVTTVPETLPFYNDFPAEMRGDGLDLVALAAPGAALQQFGERNKVEVRAVPLTRRVTPFQDVIALSELARTFRGLRPDIVQAATPKAGLLAMVAARATGVQGKIFHVLGLAEESRTGLTRVFLRASTRLACHFADRVICVSPSVREALIASGAVDPAKAVVLESGSIRGVDAERRFNPERFTAANRAATRGEYGIPLDAPVVGFVGRFARDKGVIELEAAWRRLRSAYPDAHLLMVGFRDDDYPTPSDVLDRLAHDDRVHFTGKVNDPERLFAVMDVFVLPSYKEGLPTVALEAAAMALPLVITRVTGSVDAVIPGLTGTLVPSHDAGALAQAIGGYLAAPALRQRHGQAGRAWVQGAFRPEALSQAQRDLYFELLGQPRPQPGGEQRPEQAAIVSRPTRGAGTEALITAS